MSARWVLLQGREARLIEEGETASNRPAGDLHEAAEDLLPVAHVHGGARRRPPRRGRRWTRSRRKLERGFETARRRPSARESADLEPPARRSCGRVRVMALLPDLHLRSSPRFELDRRRPARAGRSRAARRAQPDAVYGVIRSAGRGFPRATRPVGRELALLFLVLREPGPVPRSALAESARRRSSSSSSTASWRSSENGAFVGGPAATEVLSSRRSAPGCEAAWRSFPWMRSVTARSFGPLDGGARVSALRFRSPAVGAVFAAGCRPPRRSRSFSGSRPTARYADGSRHPGGRRPLSGSGWPGGRVPRYGAAGGGRRALQAVCQPGLGGAPGGISRRRRGRIRVTRRGAFKIAATPGVSAGRTSSSRTSTGSTTCGPSPSGLPTAWGVGRTRCSFHGGGNRRRAPLVGRSTHRGRPAGKLARVVDPPPRRPPRATPAPLRSGGPEPWRYAIERIRLEGVDPETWSPPVSRAGGDRLA